MLQGLEYKIWLVCYLKGNNHELKFGFSTIKYFLLICTLLAKIN